MPYTCCGNQPCKTTGCNIGSTWTYSAAFYHQTSLCILLWLECCGLMKFWAFNLSTFFLEHLITKLNYFTGNGVVTTRCMSPLVVLLQCWVKLNFGRFSRDTRKYCMYYMLLSATQCWTAFSSHMRTYCLCRACKWVTIQGETPCDWSWLGTGHKNNILTMDDSRSFRLMNTRKIRS